MDIKRLRTFVAVADLGTVSKAALRLRISQSALSRQISDLEYECGFKLFDRIGRRLFLTTRGEQLLGDCRGVLGHMGSLGERIELLKRGDSGVLKLAAPPQTIESVLSGFLPRYAERFPAVRVKLTEALGLDQLLLLDSGYSVRRLFNAACRLADVEPNILLESRAPHTLLALAEAGQGVAIIPSVLRTDRYRLRIARVTHRRKPLRDRYVIQWDKRRPMPSYAQNFCTSLAEYMREVLPITQPSSSVAAKRKR